MKTTLTVSQFDAALSGASSKSAKACSPTHTAAALKGQFLPKAEHKGFCIARSVVRRWKLRSTVAPSSETHVTVTVADWCSVAAARCASPTAGGGICSAGGSIGSGCIMATKQQRRGRVVIALRLVNESASRTYIFAHQGSMQQRVQAQRF